MADNPGGDWYWSGEPLGPFRINMSGLGKWVRTCPVCRAEPYYKADTDEGRLLESEERCDGCGLYSGEFSYGHIRERIGFCETEKGWEIDDCIIDGESYSLKRTKPRGLGLESPYSLRHKELLNETREMYNDPRCRPFLDKIKDSKFDQTYVLVFADFLQEQGIYPINLNGIRVNYRRDEAQ